MKQLMVRLNVDRDTAIRAGNRNYGAAAVPLDPAELSLEQRETLLTLPYTSLGSEYAYDLCSRDGIEMPAVPDASIDSIRGLLDAVPPARAARAAAERSRCDSAIATALAEMRIETRGSYDKPVLVGIWIGPDRVLGTADPDLAASYRARRAALETELAALHAEWAAARAAEEAAKDAAEAAAAARRSAQIAAWVAERGTDSQRARHAEGLLGEDEIVADIRRAAFLRLAQFPHRKGSWDQYPAAATASATQYEALLNIRACLDREPPMVGTAELVGSAEQEDRAIRVVVTVGELVFARHFAAGAE